MLLFGQYVLVIFASSLPCKYLILLSNSSFYIMASIYYTDLSTNVELMHYWIPYRYWHISRDYKISFIRSGDLHQPQPRWRQRYGCPGYIISTIAVRMLGRNRFSGTCQEYICYLIKILCLLARYHESSIFVHGSILPPRRRCRQEFNVANLAIMVEVWKYILQYFSSKKGVITD